MILIALALLTTPTFQSRAVPPDSRPQDDSYSEIEPVPQPSAQPQARQGETARSVAGQAGRRQTRDQVAQNAGIEPMGRVDGRIQNRVQTRVRNRIDRYYDPQANMTSPFVVAGEQARTVGRRQR